MENTKSDKMTHEEAEKTRILIREDIAKLRLARAQAVTQIDMFEARIAECELGLADIDRREAGVEYPEPPKKAEAGAEAEAAKANAETQE